jgi:GNAT superfamily N-acetyltransferase
MKITRIEKENFNKHSIAASFKSYYQELKTLNTPLPLIENGELLWAEQVEKSIGKTSALVIASNQDKVIGFGHAQLKLSPDYHGSQRIGFIAHFYVEKDSRLAGTGRKIYEELHKWFLEKNIQSIELQVINANEAAMKFWQKMGFKDELRQLRYSSE